MKQEVIPNGGTVRVTGTALFRAVVDEEQIRMMNVSRDEVFDHMHRNLLANMVIGCGLEQNSTKRGPSASKEEHISSVTGKQDNRGKANRPEVRATGLEFTYRMSTLYVK